MLFMRGFGKRFLVIYAYETDKLIKAQSLAHHPHRGD